MFLGVRCLLLLLNRRKRNTGTSLPRVTEITPTFVEMSPVGGGYFHAEVNIGSEAYTFLQGANGSVAITVVADDLAGNEGSDYYGEVPILFCPG